MQTVLIVIHLMVVVALVITVLLQRSEGGALGIGGGSSGGLFTGRGQANALTRATAILAGIFFATSIALTVLAGYSRAPRSILEGVTPPAPSAPAGQPAPGGGVLDTLKQLEQQRQQAPTPPAAPEPPRSQ